jgi:hypothetical protein
MDAVRAMSLPEGGALTSGGTLQIAVLTVSA